MAERRFTMTHEWIQWQNTEATIGITAHAQELLGDMVYVELPKIGQKIEMGAELGVVESVKAASEFYAPVSGVVTAVNNAVEADASLVNSDPLSAGWLVKMTISDPDELTGLIDEQHYNSTLSES